MKISGLHIGCLFISLLCFCLSAQSQIRVKGTVYDSSRIYRIQSVSVLATNGRGTATDSMGRYQIEVSEKDSIWFSFLGKPTPKYPVLKIADLTQFDIALTLKAAVMKEIKVFAPSYKEDSVLNRKAYAKVFNYQRPGLRTEMNGGVVGIDLDEIIRAFQFRKNRSMLAFQKRLLEEEQRKYVDHRFTKLLVTRLTGLEGKELDDFMQMYRPSFEFCKYTPEYNFQLYIKMAGEEFKKRRSF